jgi:WD40 repeat protein
MGKTRIIEDSEESLDELVKRARSDNELKRLMKGKVNEESEGKLQLEIVGNTEFDPGIGGVAFSRDGKKIAGMKMGGLEVYEVIHRPDRTNILIENRKAIYERSLITGISFNSSSQYIAVTDKPMGIMIFDVNNLDLVHRNSELQNIDASAFVKNVDFLAAAHGMSISLYRTDLAINRTHKFNVMHKISAIDTCLGPGYNHYFVVGLAGGIELYWLDYDSSEAVYQTCTSLLDSKRVSIRINDISVHENRVAAACSDGCLRMYDIDFENKCFEPLCTKRLYTTNSVRNVSLSPDGYIATGVLILKIIEK